LSFPPHGRQRNLNEEDFNDNAIISTYVQQHKETSNRFYDQIKEKNQEIKEKVIIKRNETEDLIHQISIIKNLPLLKQKLVRKTNQSLRK